MTAVHFAVSSLSALPIAYFLHWMDRSVAGFLGYFGIFIAIYAGVWCSQYFSIKSKSPTGFDIFRAAAYNVVCEKLHGARLWKTQTRKA